MHLVYITFSLIILFNTSISTSILLSPEKHTRITPIPKTSSPSSSPLNYCPISLLSLVSKLLLLDFFSLNQSFISNNNLHQFSYHHHNQFPKFSTLPHNVMSGVPQASFMGPLLFFHIRQHLQYLYSMSAYMHIGRWYVFIYGYFHFFFFLHITTSHPSFFF